MPNRNLEILQELTPNLPAIPSLDQLVEFDNITNLEYMVEVGTAIGFGLFNVGDVAVQRVFMSNGTKFPNHSHDVYEHLIVYRGILRITTPYEKDLNLGEGVTFSPGEGHAATAVGDTWFVCISIPSDPGYPHVER